MAGGGSSVRMMETSRYRNGPSKRKTPEAVRDLGAGLGRQRGDNRTREGSHRLARGTPRAGLHGREAQTSGGGRRAEAPSRWTVAPRQGEMGGEKRVQREREAV